MACCARASADAARARIAATCSGPDWALLQSGPGLLFAGARPHQLAFRYLDAGLRLRDLGLRGFDGGALHIGRGHRRVELLLRHLVLGEQAAQPLDVAGGFRGVRFDLTHPGSRRDQPRPRLLELLLCLVDGGLGLFDRPLSRRQGARGRRRRDGHGALCGLRRGLRIGKLRASLGDRDLVVARIELDEHGACFDVLVVGHGQLEHDAADARRDRRDVRVDLGIVGRLAGGRQIQPGDHADDREDKNAGDDAESRLAGE